MHHKNIFQLKTSNFFYFLLIYFGHFGNSIAELVPCRAEFLWIFRIKLRLVCFKIETKN